MSETKIAVTNDVAWLIQDIQKLYTGGQIKGLTVQIVKNDGESITAHCGDISFIEKLGLMEMAKQDLMLSTHEFI